jgi:2-polyprenyl-3-methyl-5-hydroxy-6-metoxy-1,4-benzoquinol methylase
MAALKPSNNEVIAWWSQAYPQMAPFGPEGDFAREHLLNPAILRMLGEVAGRRILDAGCGGGYLARLLARRGAQVTGVEPAAASYVEAVAAEEQESLGIAYLQRDLAVLADTVDALQPFDAVVANMVLMDIPDFELAIRACAQLLRPGGSFIFSLLHPCFEEPSTAWVGRGYVAEREYFEERMVEQGAVPFFHRPLSRYFNALLALGCALREVAEPRLDPAVAAGDPLHERAVHVPNFIVIHAVKS